MGKPEISGILDESKDNIKIIEIKGTKEETCKIDNIEKVECSICAAKCNDMTEYTHHLNVHLKSDEKQTPKKEIQIHKCYACDKMFLDKGLLENHIKLHDGNVQFNIIQPNAVNKNLILDGPGVQPVLKSHSLKSILKSQGFQPKINHPVQPIVGQGVHPLVSQEIQPIVNSQGVQPPLNQGFQPIVGQGIQSTNGKVTLFDKLNLFKCYLCSKKFISQEFVSKHIQTFHKQSPNAGPNQQTVKRSMSCAICGMSFGEKLDLNFHISVAHINDVMDNNTEPSFIAEQENNDNISKESSFQKDFNDKQPAAESHLYEHKGKLFACTLCDRSFVNVQGLNSHKCRPY